MLEPGRLICVKKWGISTQQTYLASRFSEQLLKRALNGNISVLMYKVGFYYL